MVSSAFKLDEPLIGVFVVLAIPPVLILLYGMRALTTEMSLAFLSGAAEAEHWSPEDERLEVPSAPFRDAPLKRTKQRGAPLWLRLAGGFGVALGVITSCLIAPLTFSCALLSTRLPQTSQVLTVVAGASGTAAGVVLLLSAVRAVKGEQSRYVVFLGLHYFIAATCVAVTTELGSAPSAFGWGYSALGLLLTLAFALAPRMRGASLDPQARKTSPS